MEVDTETKEVQVPIVKKEEVKCTQNKIKYIKY